MQTVHDISVYTGMLIAYMGSFAEENNLFYILPILEALLEASDEGSSSEIADAADRAVKEASRDIFISRSDSTCAVIIL